MASGHSTGIGAVMVSPEAFRFAGLTGLGFTETSFAERCNAFDGSCFRELINPCNQCLSDAIALMVAVQRFPVRHFSDTLKGFEKVADHMKVAEAEIHEARVAALTSIPAEYHRQLEIEWMAASAQKLDRLSGALATSVDSHQHLKRRRGPANKEFAAFIRLLAFHFVFHAGLWPGLTYNKKKKTYGGKFFKLAESVFAIGMCVADVTGCAQPAMWPATPNARGRSIRHIVDTQLLREVERALPGDPPDGR